MGIGNGEKNQHWF